MVGAQHAESSPASMQRSSCFRLRSSAEPNVLIFTAFILFVLVVVVKTPGGLPPSTRSAGACLSTRPRCPEPPRGIEPLRPGSNPGSGTSKALQSARGFLFDWPRGTLFGTPMQKPGPGRARVAVERGSSATGRSAQNALGGFCILALDTLRWTTPNSSPFPRSLKS